MHQCEQAAPVLDVDTGKLLEYRALLKHPKFMAAWSTSAAHKFGRLAQGVSGQVQGTDTIQFIYKNEVPMDRFKDVTYLRMVCQVRTEKKDQIKQGPRSEATLSTARTMWAHQLLIYC